MSRHPAIDTIQPYWLRRPRPSKRCFPAVSTGLRAGEALNEHITGDYWPEAPVRLERLAESIEIIQKLFTGKVVKYRSEHFNVESARIYTMPATPPPIYVATAGPIQSIVPAR
ncbi:MAG: LLM class flavin-dependent oxidoreductase [Thermomicrobiales bacterium]